MRKGPYSSFNLDFIIPFILWVIGGGIIFLSFDKVTIFSAVNTHYNAFTDQLFFFTSQFGEAHTIIILLLALLGMSSLRNWWYFTAALVCNIVPTIVEQWMKHFFNAPRPLNYFQHAQWIHIADGWPQLMSNSFPSGHSTGSFAFFCFLSLLLKEKYKRFGLLFFVLALGVCYSRMYLAAHFFADVYCGSVIGGAMCIVLFAVMRKYQYLFFKKRSLKILHYNMNNITKYALVIIAASLLFLPFLGQVHLFDWDEINFAECAREMIVSKDYLRAQIDFTPFWEKPPLFIWMQVVAMKLFGVGAYAARFPDAFIGVVTITTLFYAGKRVLNEKLAIWWILLYAASWLPHFYFKSGIIDPVFNYFIFMAFFQVYLAGKGERRALHAAIAGVFLGLAVLTKGPVAILVAALSFGVYIVVNRGLYMLKVKDLLVVALFTCLPIAIWFGADVAVFGWTYGKWWVNEFITYQIRLFRTEDADHGGPFYYHFIVLLIGCFPASMFLLNFGRKRTAYNENKDFTRWMWIMFWVVLILFSIVKTKIVHYSSLCYFPLTYLAALQVYRISYEQAQLKKWIKAVMLTIGSIVAVAITLLPVVGLHKEQLMPLFDDPFAVGNLHAAVPWSYLECFWGLLYLTGLWVSITLIRKNFRRGLLVLCVVQIITIQVTVLHFTPKIEAISQRAAIEYFESFKGKDVYVGVLGYKSYAHLFYTDKQPWTNPNYMTIGRQDQLGHTLPNSVNDEWLLRGPVDKPTYFICKIQDEHKFDTIPQLQETGNKNGFVFFKRR